MSALHVHLHTSYSQTVSYCIFAQIKIKVVLLKIDIHTHIISEKLPDYTAKFGYDGFVHLHHHKPGFARMMIGDKFFREIEENCWNPEKRIEDMEMVGVDMQVICTIPVLFYYWAKAEDCLETAKYLNDHIAEICQKYPKKFVGLATVPMQDPEMAARELERCVKELGLCGAQIGSHINDWNLSDNELYPFYQSCEELSASLFVHPWDMMAKEKMRKYWLPWLVGMPAETSLAICSMIFGGIFEKFPKMRVAFSHGGGAFPGTLGRIEHGFKMRPDLVAVDNPVNPRDYCGKFWVDSITFDSDMLQYIVKLFGADKVCLGSDYPFPLGELNTGSLIDNTPFSDEIRQKLLQDSALAWLNKKAEDFL